MLVAGKREVEKGTVSVRLRTEENVGEMSIDAFLERVAGVIRDRRGL
jgi:threonyl-tRNA synthetase